MPSASWQAKAGRAIFTALPVENLYGAGAVSAASRGLDGGDVDLAHRHHRLEDALGHGRVGVGIAFGERARRDLPRQAPAVLAPAAFAFLAAVVDDRVPQSVGLGLVVGGDHERERFAVLELRAAVEAQARDAADGEIDRQHVALLAGRVIAGRAMDGVHRAVGEGLGVEVGRVQRGAVEPQADGVLGDHRRFLRSGGVVGEIAGEIVDGTGHAGSCVPVRTSPSRR